MPKNRCYEMMTRYSMFITAYGKVMRVTLRVWTTVPEPTFGPDRRVLEIARKTERVFVPTIKELIKALDTLDNIAAFEILGPEGDGLVVYPDWEGEVNGA